MYLYLMIRKAYLPFPYLLILSTPIWNCDRWLVSKELVWCEYWYGVASEAVRKPRFMHVWVRACVLPQPNLKVLVSERSGVKLVPLTL